MLKALKDKALELAIRTWINDHYGRLGSIVECDIDTERNRFELRVLLHGESAPVTVTIDQYDIQQREGHAHLVLQRVSASRQWLTSLLGEIATGKSFKLPGPLAAML